MEIDFSTASWLQVTKWAQARIEKCRARNDGDLDALATAALRGEIKAMKNLLGLPEEAARARSAGSAE